MVSVREYEEDKAMLESRWTNDATSEARPSPSKNDVMCLVGLGRHPLIQTAWE